MTAPAENPTFAGRVHPSWVPVLEPAAGTLAELGRFLRAENAAGHGYLPAGEHVLRAFSLPLESVRVLIVGQDPYPTPGHAVGLSFSVAPEVQPVPRSLQNIYTELVEDVGCARPTTGDLSPWFERGVMLLNRCLTVRPGAPASHRGKGWETITELAIRALAERAAAGQPLAAILWGRDARNLAPLLAPMPCVESPHPSPLSARSGFFGSRPFSRTNAALEQQGADPIDWSLP
ncbi:Uracil-DNA glycosylase [Kytococcus aerolatus]|uniref:Uracil-DNA glycosylase n=1 Tax=Kytococcus aerolatus TaxID=592308 RepID=A0A212TB31_9MICO|nr:uracil-DNA glycosylase [Kytococcus aerolatus]SNC63222.1 Uracil-DNA glycosylase [Kytococcus aerolatus]